MKRIAILLAAVGLGSGCVVETTRNTGSAAIYWTYFSSDRLGTFGSITAGSTELCAAAAVEEIRITLTNPAGDTLATDSTSCITGNDVPGAAFGDLETGWWGYYIAGYRGGVLVFDDAGSFEVFDRTRTVVDATLIALYWDATINYTTTGCATGHTIEFDLYDSSTNAKVYSTWEGTPNPAVAVPCVASGALVIPSIPPGAYDFSDWIHYNDLGAPYLYNVCREWWTQPNNASVTVPTITVTAATPTASGSAGMCP